MLQPELCLVRDNLVLRLEGSEGVIGKDQGPGIQTLLNSHISRRHMGWRRLDEESIQVEDLGSTNGTFVGGQRLQKGDQVRVGLGGRVDLGREGDWVLTDQAHRKATFMKGAPSAQMRWIHSGEAEVQLRAGETLIATLRALQARLVLCLADHAGVLEEDEVPLSSTRGWVLRRDILLELYSGEADVTALNNVLARLRSKLDNHGLPDLVESQPGGGRPKPGSRGAGGHIRLRLDGAWTFSLWTPETAPRG